MNGSQKSLRISRPPLPKSSRSVPFLAAPLLRQQRARLCRWLRPRERLGPRWRWFQLIEDRPQRLHAGSERPARVFDLSPQQRHKGGALGFVEFKRGGHRLITTMQPGPNAAPRGVAGGLDGNRAETKHASSGPTGYLRRGATGKEASPRDGRSS